MGSTLPYVDLLATLVFALSGALAASRKKMDIIGFIWFATLTGVGGGTLRDLLIGAPVFWVVEPAPVMVCCAVAIVTHFTAPLIESRYRYLLWFDAIGMALVAIAGTSKAQLHDIAPLICITMGVITACFGGIVRDVLSQEPSVVMRREIYVTAALCGSFIFIAVLYLTGNRTLATALGVIAAAALRMAALAFEWQLPVYRPREGRTMDELGRE